MEMCSRWSWSINRIKLILKKNIYGGYCSKLSKALKHSMISISCIVIWRVLMYSYIRMEQQNWVIWMWVRFWRRVLGIHRQEPPIMHLQKFGRISHMMLNLIYGHWDVSCMRWSHSNPHSELKTCRDCTKKYWEVIIRRFHQNSHQKCIWLWDIWSRFHPKKDQPATNFLN